MKQFSCPLGQVRCIKGFMEAFLNIKESTSWKKSRCRGITLLIPRSKVMEWKGKQNACQKKSILIEKLGPRFLLYLKLGQRTDIWYFLNPSVGSIQDSIMS